MSLTLLRTTVQCSAEGGREGEGVKGVIAEARRSAAIEMQILPVCTDISSVGIN